MGSMGLYGGVSGLAGKVTMPEDGTREKPSPALDRHPLSPSIAAAQGVEDPAGALEGEALERTESFGDKLRNLFGMDSDGDREHGEGEAEDDDDALSPDLCGLEDALRTYQDGEPFLLQGEEGPSTEGPVESGGKGGSEEEELFVAIPSSFGAYKRGRTRFDYLINPEDSESTTAPLAYRQAALAHLDYFLSLDVAQLMMMKLVPGFSGHVDESDDDENLTAASSVEHCVQDM